MNLNQITRAISDNETIKNIIADFNNEDYYKKLSFKEKSEMLMEFNDILSELFDLDFELYINRDVNTAKKYRHCSISYKYEMIVIDGLNDNPIYYLKDILLTYFSFSNKDSYDLISVGDVYYDSNYMDLFQHLFLYNEKNIQNIVKVNSLMDVLLSNHKSHFVQEYKHSFEHRISSETLNELKNANMIADNYMKSNVYSNLKKINNNMHKFIIKKVLNEEELAMLSLNSILEYYKNCISGDDLLFNKLIEKNLISHYNQFIKKFYSEYKDYIKFSVVKGEIYINNRLVSERDYFLDVLMQEIEKISDNKDLDSYFYSKLEQLDKLLMNKNLEIINYNKWTNIYKTKDISIYKGSTPVFEELLEKPEFISVVETFLSTKSNDYQLLFKIMKFMNKSYYNSSFKLIIENNTSVNTCEGSTAENFIYLSPYSSKDKISLLATLFHEYRHLIQKEECKNDHGIFSKQLLYFFNINNGTSKLNNNYPYADYNTCGYSNDMLYCMQPIEYDAENFSEKFLDKIISKMNKKIKYRNDEYFFNTYKNLKYLDREKLSLESYRNYLKIDEVDVYMSYENEEFYSLSKKIQECKLKNQAIEIFKHELFEDFHISEKLKVYNIIAGENIKISYNESKKSIYINDNKYNAENIYDFDLLEIIIGLQADYLIENNQLKWSERNQFIYDESKKYKTKTYNEFDCNRAFTYHYHFDKYSYGRGENKDKIVTYTK